jgi:hypothetical protein
MVSPVIPKREKGNACEVCRVFMFNLFSYFLFYIDCSRLIGRWVKLCFKLIALANMWLRKLTNIVLPASYVSLLLSLFYFSIQFYLFAIIYLLFSVLFLLLSLSHFVVGEAVTFEALHALWSMCRGIWPSLSLVSEEEKIDRLFWFIHCDIFLFTTTRCNSVDLFFFVRRIAEMLGWTRALERAIIITLWSMCSSCHSALLLSFTCSWNVCFDYPHIGFLRSGSSFRSLLSFSIEFRLRELYQFGCIVDRLWNEFFCFFLDYYSGLCLN